MKRSGSLLLALALAATGCVELPIRPETKPGRAAKEAPRFTVEPPEVRRPEQVNDGNARQATRRPAGRAGPRRKRAGARPAFDRW